tara:strand:+ start:186 stop:482 length:297 start_codon:yes stop_codon:yes gene_type:complete
MNIIKMIGFINFFKLLLKLKIKSSFNKASGNATLIKELTIIGNTMQNVKAAEKYAISDSDVKPKDEYAVKIKILLLIISASLNSLKKRNLEDVINFKK